MAGQRPGRGPSWLPAPPVNPLLCFCMVWRPANNNSNNSNRHANKNSNSQAAMAADSRLPQSGEPGQVQAVLAHCSWLWPGLKMQSVATHLTWTSGLFTLKPISQ